MPDALLKAAPVPGLGESLERLSPCLLEVGLAYRTHILEALKIELAHFPPPSAYRFARCPSLIIPPSRSAPPFLCL